MRSENHQQREAARKTKMNERIKRRRSSSRCSRKDIWPPSSSSPPRLVESDLKSADIAMKFELEPILLSNRLCFCLSGFRGNFYRFRRSVSECFGKGLWLSFAGNQQFGSGRVEYR